MNRIDGAGESEMLKIAREVLAEADLLVDPERKKLITLLKTNDWNKSKTARDMGVSEGAIRKRIKDYGISRPPKD
jgi:transcriptional regulator of acetoin/glycerol metabolism